MARRVSGPPGLRPRPVLIGGILALGMCVLLVGRALSPAGGPGKAEDTPLPPAAAFQAAVVERNATFTEELLQVLSAHPGLKPDISGPGGGNVLITNWRYIAAVYLSRAEGPELDSTLLESVFRELVTVTYTETTELSAHREFYPSADGTLREVEVRSPRSVLRVEVSCAEVEMPDSRTAARLDALLGRALTADPAIDALFPPDLSARRRGVVRAAAGLVGRVGYFWGGKSDALGWDTRWGAPALVTSEGSGSTSSVRPFGLDCSGLVSWAAVTASGGTAAYGQVGDGVRAQREHCATVPWSEAQPGDLLFFPDLSHVGIAVGFDSDGRLKVVHCSSSLGGVVLSEDAAAVGFTEAGRPSFYNY